jgi:hypothetical protein
LRKPAAADLQLLRKSTADLRHLVRTSATAALWRHVRKSATAGLRDTRYAEALKKAASALSVQAQAWHRACRERQLSTGWRVGASLAAAALLCWAAVELCTGGLAPRSTASAEITWIPPEKPWHAPPAAAAQETSAQSRLRSAFEDPRQPLFARLAVLRPDLLPPPFAGEREATDKLWQLREAITELPDDESLRDVAQVAEPETTHSVGFAGVWAPTASACSPKSNRRQLLPAVINHEGAWAGEVTCTFRHLRQEGNVAVASSTCSNGRKRWAANVRIAVEGDRLTWSSERGSQSYVRCNSRVVEGQGAARDPV